jgi:hypothetical protein
MIRRIVARSRDRAEVVPRHSLRVGVALVAALACTGNAAADTAEARCDIYPRGEDRASAMVACRFSQRQGFVTITRSDGVSHDLEPEDDDPGRYRDQRGRRVVREDALGPEGLVFRFPDESVYVYWDTSALSPPTSAADNPTAPYTTKDYDATTLLRCGRVGSSHRDQCPAGILRMEGGQASLVITGPDGKEFTINFMKDYVNATSGEAQAVLNDDTWTVTIDGKHVYEVPQAAIDGG